MLVSSAAAASRNGVSRSRSHPLPPVNSGPSSSSSGLTTSGQTTSPVTASTSASMSSVTNETGVFLHIFIIYIYMSCSSVEYMYK